MRNIWIRASWGNFGGFYIGLYHWIVDCSRQFRGGSLVWIESGRNTVSRVFASVLDSADNTSRLHNRSVNQRRDWPLPTSYPPRRQPVKSTRLETPGQGKIVKLDSDNSPPTCINCRINYRSSLLRWSKIRIFEQAFKIYRKDSIIFLPRFESRRERNIFFLLLFQILKNG